MVNLGPLAAEIVSLVWGNPGNFNGFRVLAALLRGTLVVGLVERQTAAFNRGRHLYTAGRRHVGHWPTFLAMAALCNSAGHYIFALWFLSIFYLLSFLFYSSPISLQLRHVSTLGKNVLSGNISSTCLHNMVNFGPLTAEIISLVWGTPGNFNGFRVLAALLHGTLVVGVSQSLRR